VKSEYCELVTSQLSRHSVVSAAHTLLLVEFTTLSDYLHYLHGVAQLLTTCGHSAMMYLAAAVSDFYIPTSDMASCKLSVIMIYKSVSQSVSQSVNQQFNVSLHCQYITVPFILHPYVVACTV